MRLLHASFSADKTAALWAEGTPESIATNSGDWPFALQAADLAELLATAFHLRNFKHAKITGWLPTLDGQPVPSSPLIAETPRSGSNAALQVWSIDAASVLASTLLELLGSMEDARVEPGIFCAGDLMYWAGLVRFGLHLAVTQKFIPGLQNGKATWRPILMGDDKQRFEQFTRSMPPVCRAFYNGGAGPVSGAHEIAAGFLELVLHTTIAESQPPAAPAGKTIHDQWLSALGRPGLQRLSAPGAVLPEFEQTVREWSAPLVRRMAFDYRLAFRLEEPTPKKDFWFIRYFLQNENEPSLLLPLEKVWNSSKSARRVLGRQMDLAVQNALVGLAQAGKIDAAVEMSLTQAQPGGYRTGTDGAWQFLNTKAWILQDSGFGILLPSWWGRKQSMRLGLKAKVKGKGKKAFSASEGDSLIDFDWKLAIGKEEITYEELMALARMKVPLVKFRGKWIELRPEQIQAASDFWKSKQFDQARLSDLIKLLTRPDQIAGELPVSEIEATGWLSKFLHEFHEHASYSLIPPPRDFAGQLRDYQQRGFSWLFFMKKYGLGACLADDMGLGKTVQSIALMLEDKTEDVAGPVLLICPTSVVGNWQRELERFAPSLHALIHHGVQRKKGAAFQEMMREYDIVLSSYSLLLRDIETLGGLHWRGVILDEAQNIKNAETKQAKAARALEADYRVALTGTPVENNIGELWSLFEFLNPGLLGTRAEFKERYFNPIHSFNSPEAAQQLKRVTEPFLLRRLKSDPEIASELPRKLEMKVFCNLTKEQASLYAAVVRALEKDLEESEGIERKGKILASLSKLKQICNHPAHFLRDGSPLPGRSGKLARLTEMLEEVVEVGDRALVFTQFVEMGDLLKAHLQNYFGLEAAWLHGGVARTKREQMIERFNEDPEGPQIFLLSLKAGGTGLNLTRANHVFHYDRWWNPAVEDQATDRAYRIGQKKNVQVHKMVCIGTLEERIDQMIDKKKAVAEAVIGTGEAWLTELSTSEIKSLVALGKDAVSV